MIEMDNGFYGLICFAVISVISIFITVYDKSASKKGKRRISEKALMLTGFFGGATAMYAVMNAIRHKTKHKKFMVGLPVFIFLHIAAIIFFVYFQH